MSAASVTAPSKDHHLVEQVATPETSPEILHRFLEIRQKIRPLFELLGKTPNNELEQFLASETNTMELGIENIGIRIDLAVLHQTEDLYDSFMGEYTKLKEGISAQLDSVNLKIKEFQEQEEIILGITPYRHDVQNLLTQLEKKFELIESKKFSRLKQCILEIRSQIIAIWNDCHISQEDRTEFEIQMTTEQLTETLWHSLQTELEKWKVYQDKNRSLFEKVKQRSDMWLKLRELETKSRDPNRFVNRGGTLLKDQAELNALMKNVPKLETQLKRLATQFQAEYGKHVSINGKTIGEMIEEDWANFKKEKGYTGRKHKDDQPEFIEPQVPSGRNLPRRSVSVRAAEKRPSSVSETGKLKRKCLEY